MMVIGIAGGVACGKSLVAEQLRRLGAAVLDADRVGHAVLCDPEVIAAARQRWGAGIQDGDGRIDRRKLAAIVFAPPPQGPGDLAFLEQLTHPRIGQRLREQMEECQQQGTVSAVVLDAAVMFKAGWDALCDVILFVDAPRAVRLARARQRGWSEAEFQSREAAQEGLDEKRRRAHVIIDNSSSPDHTFQQLREAWPLMLAQAAGTKESLTAFPQ
jgi:dephospho-CoA kinase